MKTNSSQLTKSKPVKPHSTGKLVVGLALRVALLSSALASSAFAQDAGFTGSSLPEIRIVPNSVLDTAVPLINIDREIETNEFQSALVDDALNFNFGVQLTPIEGLNVSAEAWRVELDEAPAASLKSSSINDVAAASSLPQIVLQDDDINAFVITNPFLGSIESNGVDLGASYKWGTDRFGEFTLSSKTTYVYSFENRESLLTMPLPQGLVSALGGAEMSTPELQSSLMLNWKFGQHSASAITNYFDSFKDLSELNIEEINELVDNITTLDLQYGYTLKSGNADRAVISFGIRNLFDEKTTQLLNSTKRILDQNGRVAYGAIKYQF